MGIWDRINAIDVDEAARRFRSAEPFPHIVIDDFLKADFARAISESFPSYNEAEGLGRAFRAVNENLKVQITDPERFPAPVRAFSDLHADPEFVEMISRLTSIPNLLADPQLVGGGMHVMGSGGRLDVHVDFNLIRDRALHRRLNLLLFFNEGWGEGWGGRTEFWDADVKECKSSVAPIHNRCVMFETSEISYHGVTLIRSPADRPRKSFAAYYYTQEPPEGWDGTLHSTVFKGRPDERFRERVMMPAERAIRSIRPTLRKIKRALLGRRS